MAKLEKDAAAEPERTVADRIAELRRRRKAALSPGGRDAAQKQHDRGKLLGLGHGRSLGERLGRRAQQPFTRQPAFFHPPAARTIRIVTRAFDRPFLAFLESSHLALVHAL